MNKEKPSLPPGWVVKQSKTYPDLVYYFNKHTGVSTWNMPKLINPNHVSAVLKRPRDPRSQDPRSQDPHAALKEKATYTARFSSNDDSDSSASFSDTEKYDPKNEPVFSKFQKEIFDDVITNDTKHEPSTPGKELLSSEVEAEKGGTNSSSKPPKLKWDVEHEVEFKGEGVEFPKVNVKTEKTGTNDTKSSRKQGVRKKPIPFNISDVLSKIRKDVENSECDLRRTMSSISRKKIVQSSKGQRNVQSENAQRIVKPDKEQSNSSKTIKSVDSSAGSKHGKHKSTNADDTVRKVVCLSEKDTKGKDVSEHVVKHEQSPRTVQKSTEKLSTPGAKGIWTRKRKISSKTTDDEVPAKSWSKPDLSLEVCVGEKRTVILSPKRAVVERTVSSDSLDLTAQSPPLQPEKPISLKPGASSNQSGNLENIDVLTDSLSEKVRRRRVSVMTEADIRKVVPSENTSDTNTNNSGLSEHVVPQKPLQADRLGRVQAWVDHIDGIPPARSEASKEDLSSNVVLPQALPVHHQDESEFCDMEVDGESEDEQMIIDLQEVRGELQFCPSEQDAVLSVWTRAVPPSQYPSQCLYLIVDTSSLMNHLKSISEIRDTPIERYGLPVMVIPWVVLQELDALKDNRSRQTFSLNSQNRANRAVKYLNACFTGKHPRVIGQSPQEASKLVEGLQVECNDDRVLQCCLQYKEEYPFSTIVMVSEDVNLRSKAQVSFLDTCSVKDFSDVMGSLPFHEQNHDKREPTTTTETHIMSQSVSASSTTHGESVSDSYPHNNPQPVTTTPSSKVKLQRNQLDRVVVKVKSEIKDTLGLALENEMRAAFEKLWKEVVYRKPPWSALDIMESFQKHWIAVFGLIMPKYVSPVIKSIVTKLQLNKVPLLSVEEVMELVQDLITMMTSLRKHSSYNGKVDKSIDKLKAIVSDLRNGNVSQAVVSPPSQVSVGAPSSHMTGIHQPSRNSLVSTQPKQDSVQPQQQLHQTSSNKVRSEQCAKEKEQSNKTVKSDKSVAIPSTSSNTRLGANPGSSSTTKSMTNPSIPMEDLQKVENCFQTVWQGIHAVCVQIEISLVQSITDDDINLLNLLLPLIKDLRYHFAMSLSISPYEIYNQTKQFEDLCNELNNFFTRLKLETVDMQPVSTDALQAFFCSTDKRPSLQIGLGQLDDIIKNLYELIKNLPD